MDKSHLSSAERKELRKELLGMKKEAKAMTSGGVYLSVGAIIIIILIIITFETIDSCSFPTFVLFFHSLFINIKIANY